MAVCKSITLDNGVVTNYHRILSAYLCNETEPTLNVRVGSYVSGDYRDEEKTEIAPNNVVHISEYNLDFDMSEPMDFGNIYEKLKTIEAFSDAEDC